MSQVTATSDLADRTILITGANAGIGRSTAVALGRRGARLILAGRSEARTRPVIDELAAAGNPHVTFVPLDLADLASVRACADRVLALGGPLHVLINNAAVAGARGLTKDGFEVAFGTNHLGPFLLTLRLFGLLRSSAPARVVNVASRAHRRVERLDFEALRRPRSMLGTGMRAYAVSKLANVLFNQALARRLRGTGVTTYALHPGVIASDLWRRVPTPVRQVMNLFMISSDQGARTTIHCASAPALADESGLYYDENQQVVRPTPLAEDVELAERLWTASAMWVGQDL
jgi:NAD(P)-dependent dehydrogenase (short-subunit alcohol dehydrogenase family)